MKDDKSRILPLLMDPRQPDENNRAYAYRILRKNIMNIQLQPGCQLSEAELSEHLVMSRTPIHEALMMLDPVHQRGLCHAQDAGTRFAAQFVRPPESGAAQ